jgi:hypothetical protein
MTTNQKISAAIKTLVEAGATVPQAVDLVLGAGAYVRIANEVYDELRGRVAK